MAKNTENSAIISVRVDARLHKDCRVKLMEEGRTVADLVRSALNQYLDGDMSITA